MDLISAIAIANKTFELLKKGFSAGKDASSMMHEVGKWMSANDVIKEQANKQKSGKSVQAESLDLFAQMKKAKAQEEELRNFLIATYGMDAWNDLLRIQGQIRKQRKQAELERQRHQKEVMTICIVIFGILVGGILLIWLVNKLT